MLTGESSLANSVRAPKRQTLVLVGKSSLGKKKKTHTQKRCKADIRLVIQWNLRKAVLCVIAFVNAFIIFPFWKIVCSYKTVGFIKYAM